LRPPTSTLFPYTTLFRSGLVFLPIVYRSDARQREHAPLPIWQSRRSTMKTTLKLAIGTALVVPSVALAQTATRGDREYCGQLGRSEEHTSELQSPCNLVC